MSAVPQNILDALNAVQADQDTLGQAKQDDASADAALAAAQQQKANTSAAVTAAQQHLATDLAALIQLEQQTYGG